MKTHPSRSWVLMKPYGRRPILFWGTIGNIVPNFIIGGLGTIKGANKPALYTIGALMIWINFNYHLTIGPVTYTVASEIPASTLRVTSIAFGRLVYTVNGIIIGTLNPYMVNATAWNWSAKSGFFWAGTGIICAIWIYLRLPETRNLTFKEIDVLFANHIAARDFDKADMAIQIEHYEQRHDNLRLREASLGCEGQLETDNKV